MLDAIRRLFALRRVKPERQPDIRHVRFGNVTVGVNIHAPEEFLKISTVWRCVNLRANAIATLPWETWRRDFQTDKLERSPRNPVNRLLNNSPNPEMSAFTFRTTFIQHKMLYGNAYAEIERDGAGRPVALWPIAPDRVEPCRDERGELFYRISQPTGGFGELDPEDMFHVPGLSWDGVRGYSILEVGMQSLGGAYAMDRFAGRFFGRGMMPGGILTVPEDMQLDEEGLARLRKEFEDKHQGWLNSQSPLILDGGMEFKQTTTDPEKGQFLDTRKFSVFDICRWFGVPPYLAFASDEEPRANVETQSREFLMYGLDPDIASLEQEANRKLFVAQGFETKMDTREFRRGDLATMTEFWNAMRSNGAGTANMILRDFGFDEIGPEGDVRVMQVQFQPIGPDGAPTAPRAPGESGGAGETDSPPPPNGDARARMNGGAKHEA